MEKIFFADHHAEHNADFIFHLPSGHNCWLLVLTKTAASFQVDGKMKQYGENHVILFHPDQPIKYQACTDHYINGWIRFNLESLFFDQSQLNYGVPLYMNDQQACHQLTKLIAHEHQHGNKSVAIHLLKGLLCKLMYSHGTTGKDLAIKFNELRQEIKVNPGFPWTITYMSRLMNLSEGYFHRTYKKLYGRSCMTDVIEIRLNHAANLLKTGKFRINQIAYQCGYKNVEHFSRQFRDKFGISPAYFKKIVPPL
ncbi:helix-turn-helix transcriptional regulator [Amphibacillus jilinensis]|uniref:helix-turn-helix transcriptional regulator n=1 Tax=Amphibacillus jilinensis TaxID=1216008 RepID=UPI0002F66674|nr:AraC family transcriptional regulator [Amphibacillus jilinensis]